MQMNVKLLIAAVATVFISVVAGAVISTMANAPAQTAVEVAPTAEATATMPATETPSPEPTMRPVVDAEVVLQREATYQARLAEANQLLEEASAALVQSRANERQIANRFNQVVSQPTATTVVVQAVAAAPETTVQQVSTEPQRLAPESALAIAVALDPAAQLLRAPELVMYENAMAYEFIFDRGTIYVNAVDGTVMYNGIAVMQEAQRQAAVAAAAAAPAPQPTAVPTYQDDDNDREDDRDEDHGGDREDDHGGDREDDHGGDREDDHGGDREDDRDEDRGGEDD